MSHSDADQPRARIRTPDFAPWIAVVAVSLALALIPIAHTPSRTYLLVFAVIAVASLLSARFDQRGRWQSIVFWPALLLLGAFACSIAASDLRPLLTHRFWTMPVLALLMPMAQIACWRPTTRRVLLRLVCLTVVLCAIDLMLQRWAGWSVGGRVLQGEGNVIQSGSLGNPNDLAAMVILLPLAATVLPRRSVAGWTVLIALLACTNIAALLSASRQVLIGWLLGALSLSTNGVSRAHANDRPNTRFNRTAVALVVLVGVVFILQFTGISWLSTPELGERFDQTIDEGVGISRAIQYRYAWMLFTESPWLGIGLGGFGEYWALGLAKGWTWNGTPLSPVVMPWVHNIELELLCETGLLGALAFTICLLDALRRCRRGLRAGGALRVLALAVLGSGCVFLVIGLVDLSFIKDWVRVVFWLGLGLAAAAGTPRAAPREPPPLESDDFA